MKRSTKVVLAGAAAITVVSAGVGIGMMVPLTSANVSQGAPAAAPKSLDPAAAAAAAAAGTVGSRTLSGVSGGAADYGGWAGFQAEWAPVPGSVLPYDDPAGSPIGDGQLPNAVSPVKAVAATLARPAAKPPAKARTVSTVTAPSTPAPTKAKKKTSGSAGSGSVAPVVLSGDQPGPGNTGVPAGTALTVMNGDLTITTAGATYSGLDIHGFVKVEAPM